MKKFIGVLLLVLLSRLGLVLADEQPKGGELSLPWQEFEKLFKLNQDNVTLTWDEFQKLIKQTGVQELPDYQVQNGQVVLSRTEFKQLLDRMKTPAAEASKYFLTKAVYSGRIGNESTLIKANLRLQIIGKDNAEPIRIPLFPAQMAFQEVLFDDQPALIENDGSQLYVVTRKTGEHVVTAVFSTPSSLKKPPHELAFSVPRTPITQVNITVPIRNVDVKVANASETQLISVDEGTLVKATLPVTQYIQLAWNPVAPEKEKAPAKIYADIYNLLTIEEDALRVRTQVDLDILQNTINTINVKVPEGYAVLDVQGDSVGDWKMQGTNSRVLVVPLQFAHSGKYSLTISAELLLKEKNVVAAFDGFEVLKATREKGFVGVELKSSAEAKPLELSGLDRVDTQEIPQALQSLATRPLLYGFKYLRQPYSFNLDIQKHEEVAVISTVIDDANGVTMVMEDGKRVHNITYTVRNSWKQFLELKLPEGAQVWGTFVEGQRVKPSRNEKGNILIPLNRSKSNNGDLSSFDVEIMYYQGTSNLKPVGKESLEFPIPDVVVSQMFWSVYLPVNFDYLYFGGNVDKEEGAEGLNPVLSVLRGAQSAISNAEKSQFDSYYRDGGPVTETTKNERQAKVRESSAWRQRSKFNSEQSISDSSYLKQMDQEFKFFNQVRSQAAQVGNGGGAGGDLGVLPIRVKVPNTGKVFRFTKKILVDQAPVNLSIVYLNHWFVRILLLALLAGLLYGLYRIRRTVLVGIVALQKFKVEHQNSFDWARSPFGFMVVCFCAMVLAFAISRVLGALMLVVCLGASLRWVLMLYKSKIQKTEI